MYYSDDRRKKMKILGAAMSICMKGDVTVDDFPKCVISEMKKLEI